MICEEKIQLQLPLENLVEKLEASRSPQPKFPHLKGIWRTPEALKEYHRQYRLARMERFREYQRAEYKRNHARYEIRRGSEEYKASPSSVRLTISLLIVGVFLVPFSKKEICARKSELAKTANYRERQRKYKKAQRLTSVQFALKDAMRATLNRAFRRNWVRKPYRTEVLIGCTISELKLHIEKQFVNGMSWENRRSFHVDHWIPVNAFDLADLEEARLAFNWSNLRPLSPHDNSTKSDILPTPLPSWLPAHIAARIQSRNATETQSH